MCTCISVRVCICVCVCVYVGVCMCVSLVLSEQHQRYTLKVENPIAMSLVISEQQQRCPQIDVKPFCDVLIGRTATAGYPEV